MLTLERVSSLLIVVLAFSIAQGCRPTKVDHEQRIPGLISDHSELLDPFSAQFRGLRYEGFKSTGWEAETWCGEINAKNSFGAYTGWQFFRLERRKSGNADPEVDFKIYKTQDLNLAGKMLYATMCSGTKAVDASD